MSRSLFSGRTYKILALSIFALSMIGLSSCTQQHESGWELVYKNDADGNALYGSKEELINAVRAGNPIRIGFGFRSRRDSSRTIEHVSDAEFLTILDGEHVFAQVPQIIGQRPTNDEGDLKIFFRENNKWTKIAGTNGFSTGLMVDFINDSLVNHGADNRAGTSWYVQNLKGEIREAEALWR